MSGNFGNLSKIDQVEAFVGAFVCCHFTTILRRMLQIAMNVSGPFLDILGPDNWEPNFFLKFGEEKGIIMELDLTLELGFGIGIRPGP